MKILVTGINGIIGRQCADFLKLYDMDIHGISRNQDPLANSSITFHKGDVLDLEFTSTLIRTLKPTHLLHLAWTTGHGLFWEDPANHDWYDASLHLASEFAKNGGIRMIAAGTCAEYDWQSTTIETEKCHEFDTPLASMTLYGRTKNRLRQTLQSELDISFGWGRVFFPYGPYENKARLVPHVITTLLNNETVRIGPGTDIRDFISTNDAGAAFGRLLMSDVEGPVNIASGQGHSIAEVAMKIAEKLERVEMLKIGALPPRPTDPPFLVGNNSRLIDEVGMKKFQELDEGLEIAIDWWKANNR